MHSDQVSPAMATLASPEKVRLSLDDCLEIHELEDTTEKYALLQLIEVTRACMLGQTK